MSVQITKEDFIEYERLRRTGKWNMFDPRVRLMSDLNEKQWSKCMSDYGKFYKAWITDEIDEELNNED
jgi:hypothetical protein